MPDIMTLIDRIEKMSELTLKMHQTVDMKEFYKLQDEWDTLKTIYSLEDELNEKTL